MRKDHVPFIGNLALYSGNSPLQGVAVYPPMSGLCNMSILSKPQDYSAGCGFPNNCGVICDEYVKKDARNKVIH